MSPRDGVCGSFLGKWALGTEVRAHFFGAGGYYAPISLPATEVFFSLQVKIVSPGGCCAPVSLPATQVFLNLQVKITTPGGYYPPVSLPATQVFFNLQVMITTSGGYYDPVSLPATQVLFNLQVIRAKKQVNKKTRNSVTGLFLYLVDKLQVCWKPIYCIQFIKS